MNKPQKEGEIWEQPFLHEHLLAKTQAVMTHRVLSTCAPTWGPAQGWPPSRPGVLAAGPHPDLPVSTFPPQHKKRTKQEQQMTGNSGK